MQRLILDSLQATRAAKRPAALITAIESGVQCLFEPGQDPQTFPVARMIPQVVLERVDAALRGDCSQCVDSPRGRYFIQVFNPPLRLVIVGAVHITQNLAPMAQLAGYQITVIDPRPSFATAERFPGYAMVTDWPDEALEALAPDSRTAVVTLTHDPKLDDPALQVALGSTAFYIGCLGSRRTHAARLERLRAAGFEENALRRLHAPIGLNIGARSAAEIALATVAEITASLRQAEVKT